MKRNLGSMLFILALISLAACGNNADSKEEEVPEILEVQLEVAEQAAVDEKVDLKAIVTQGDEDVADANEVEYEIWEEGKKDDSIMVDAENNNDGTYVAETTFDHDGVYTVQVHVTARGMHNMPKQTVTVGEGAAEETHEHGDHEGEDHDHGDHDHGEHSDNFSMHFMKPEDVNKGAETDFTVHLQNEDAPLEKANVRYEIWLDGAEKHEWVAAKESTAGEYTAKFTFEETGTYHTIIHVENDEGLHEHEEHEIDVK